MSLTVDEEGLRRVLSEWAGAGNLYRAVAATAPAQVAREWSPQDVERRAMRILLLECSPLLRRWPKSARAWMDHIPALSQRHRFWSEVPQSRVDWAKTRQRGWPPDVFAIRRRHRSTDQVTLSMLAWTLGRLKAAFEASQSLVGPHAAVAEEFAGDVQEILRQTLPLLDLLDESDEGKPSRDSIRAVRGAGWPWNAVADVADLFVALDRGGADALARRLLRPDGFPEALFQLSILGSMLVAAQEIGAAVTSVRPIGHMTDGPVYRIELPGQSPWDLWCEAARCWSAYGLVDGYRDVAATLSTVEGTPFQARHIRPDLLLARPGDRALVFECKYPGESLDPGYIAHGMYQAAFYGHQLAPAFQAVAGYAIGPTELVSTHEERIHGTVIVGVTTPRAVRDLMASAMGVANSLTTIW